MMMTWIDITVCLLRVITIKTTEQTSSSATAQMAKIGSTFQDKTNASFFLSFFNSHFVKQMLSDYMTLG